MNQESKLIVLERYKDYAVIRLNRPERKNGIVPEMSYAWAHHLNVLATDDSIKLVVITGTGEYYTSGADFLQSSNRAQSLGSNGGINESSKLEATRKLLHPFKNLVESFIKFPKPIIAAVNGPAIGMGVTTLPLCDVVYASSNGTFLTPFSKIAMTPEACSTYTFPLVMGYSKANEMLLFNRKISAEEACNFGLVSQVFPKETFRAEVQKRIDQFVDNPAKCLEYGKALIRGRDKEMLFKVNEEECDRVAERFLSEDAVIQGMKFIEERRLIRERRKAKL